MQAWHNHIKCVQGSIFQLFGTFFLLLFFGGGMTTAALAFLLQDAKIIDISDCMLYRLRIPCTLKHIINAEKRTFSNCTHSDSKFWFISGLRI